MRRSRDSLQIVSVTRRPCTAKKEETIMSSNTAVLTWSETANTIIPVGNLRTIFTIFPFTRVAPATFVRTAIVKDLHIVHHLFLDSSAVIAAVNALIIIVQTMIDLLQAPIAILTPVRGDGACSLVLAAITLQGFKIDGFEALLQLLINGKPLVGGIQSLHG